MKKTIGTVIWAAAVLSLIASALLRSDRSLSVSQRGTLNILLIVCVCSIAYCFIAGELTRNYSQMDKLWSLLPIAYTWIIAAGSGMKIRPVLFALIVTAWGIRLTINFARKGAYRLKFWTGEEDYRWAVVRGMRFFRHRIAWIAFDLFFISAYQNTLVLLICLPALAGMDSTAPLGLWDALAVSLSVLFLILETAADETQWKFHRTKKELLKERGSLDALPEPYCLGFNTCGIWAYMRHPNYLGEQGFWLSLYLPAIGAGAAQGPFRLHWSVVGSLLLVLLFMGSSRLGESISAKKYPRYKDYAEQVFKYLPLRRFDPGIHGT